MQHISSHKTVETLRDMQANPPRQAMTQEPAQEPKPAPPDKAKEKPVSPKGS